MRTPTILLLAGLAAGLRAENARFDVDGQQAGIRIEQFSLLDGCQGQQSNGHWLKDEKDRPRFLYSGFTIPARTWTRIGIRFVPSGTGAVKLILRGPYKLRPGADPTDPKRKIIPVPVVWDDVEAEGARITNGDFEKGSDGADGGSRDLPGWTFVKDDQTAEVLSGAGTAHGGQRAVRSWHSSYVYQMIRVQKDRPVTITVWAWAEPAS